MKNLLFAAIACALAAHGGVPGAAHADDGLAWARGRVWYQIFPERFRNGDPANDPAAAEVPEGGRQWRPSRWTGDWYERQPWEVRRSTDFYDPGVVFARRYGGDIQGIIDKLDYLKDLGIDVIYLNPIFEAESLHKYDSSSLHHVDDNFGPDPAGDKKLLAEARETEDPGTWIWTKADIVFLRLVREAHSRGIRVVIDGVFNHTGRSFFAFQDILQKGKQSRYAGWYGITSWGDKPGESFDYDSWAGFKSLPVLAKDSQGLVPGPKKYVFDITRRWLAPQGDPAQGVDGFRLDVIEEVPAPFWKEWRAYVKSIKPEAITVSEIWGDASAWVREGRVDSSMNYQFAEAVASFFIDRKKSVTGARFARRLRKLLASYKPQNAQLLLNLVDSHDTDRLASMILNPDRKYGQGNRVRENPSYDVRKPDAAAWRVLKQIAAFQMTFLGAPMVYYGDEAGMWGAGDPDDRKPMLWPDKRFSPEKTHPLAGRARPADLVAFDSELHDAYKSLIRLRHQSPALMSGDLEFLDAAVSRDTVGFVRRCAIQEAVILFNRSERPWKSDMLARELGHPSYRDAASGAVLAVARNRLSVEVPARGFVVLFSEPEK
ncbi:MAG TPA: alpha-amylase [Elusimicrobia bacterium]|nr:alpha-amylase [Elusimicrobiota bacterium]HBT61660.1 alpha-amylase [Elusimicrobiota bacterium]